MSKMGPAVGWESRMQSGIVVVNIAGTGLGRGESRIRDLGGCWRLARAGRVRPSRFPW